MTARRIAAEVIAWWVVGTGLWCVFISTVTWPEVMAGAGAALIAAGGAGHMRVIGFPTFRPRASWARWLPQIPVRALRDMAPLTRLVVDVVRRRPTHSELRTVQLSDPAHATVGAHLAFATLALTSTPATYVIATYDDGTARVHVVGDAGDIAGWVRS